VGYHYFLYCWVLGLDYFDCRTVQESVASARVIPTQGLELPKAGLTNKQARIRRSLPPASCIIHFIMHHTLHHASYTALHRSEYLHSPSEMFTNRYDHSMGRQLSAQVSGAFGPDWNNCSLENRDWLPCRKWSTRSFRITQPSTASRVPQEVRPIKSETNFLR
jgi:hypothetical protein